MLNHIRKFGFTGGILFVTLLCFSVGHSSLEDDSSLPLKMFIASKIVLFAMLYALTLFKERSLRHIILPAGMVFASCVYAIFAIAFEPEHFVMGTVYSTYLGLTCCLLIDGLFNQAKITEKITGRIMKAVLSSISGI